MVLKYGPRKVASRNNKISLARENLCSMGEEDKCYQRGWNFSMRESSLGRFIPRKSLPHGRISWGSVFPKMPFPWGEFS